MSFQNNYQPIWTKPPNANGYQYAGLKLVEREDPTLLELLPKVNGASAERAGYKYWYNATGKYGPYVARKETGAIPNQRPSSNPIQEQVNQQHRGPSDLQAFIDDSSAWMQAMDMKIDKILEILKITQTVETQRASAMISERNNNHGNESSGSDAASSGLGVVENPVHITDEQTEDEDDVTDQ
jgi:hypothetical protein